MKKPIINDIELEILIIYKIEFYQINKNKYKYIKFI